MSSSGPRSRAAARVQARTVAVPSGRRPALTGRAVVLAVVVLLVVLSLAGPLRELLRQRAQIGSLRASNTATAAEVTDLQQRQQRLQDPAYVQALIRGRLHYVLPGETGYVVLEPDEAPAPASAAAGDHQPWYSQLWSGVEAADGQPAVTSGPVPARTNAPR